MTNLPDIIVFGGSPGSGKSTLMRAMQTHFNEPPTIDFGNLRNLYLDRHWKRASPEEEAMAYDILLYALPKYIATNAGPILMDDFKEERLGGFAKDFAVFDYRIITLYAEDDEVIKQRVIARNDGFKDFEEAVAWNARIRNRASHPFETKLAIDGLSPQDVFASALKFLS